ncbi:hypothetical protein SAMN05428938_8806 [Streptomyces sp. KS_5]|nr:hypothetical protein SAMN05216482_8460 [Streptomyces sp. PAN_FS17]SEE80754.1 hypothetical protein SAMN05428938_8806 [Streptomyces sp. KS_5]
MSAGARRSFSEAVTAVLLPTPHLRTRWSR